MMRNFTRNRFPIKNMLIDSNSSSVWSNYLNADMVKFESSQKDGSRAHSPDSSKVYSKFTAFRRGHKHILMYTPMSPKRQTKRFSSQQFHI